jgi:enamine deaminase RidA (YjgF/YER057c/UK114 family)
MTAKGNSMPNRSYAWPEGHWDWYQHLAFKHGVRAGEMVFVGGQVDKTPGGDPLHAYDLATQTQVVIRHIDTVLREFGAGLVNVVKLVAFYANDGRVDEAAFLAEIGQHILAHAGISAGAGPTISLVPLPCLALPGMMVEIEAIAMLGREGEILERRTANPSELAPLPSPFSHGVRCREHIWTSAQRSRSRDGRIQHPGEIRAQTEVAMGHLNWVLDALGANLNDTVKLSTWYRGDGTRATWEPAARQRVSYFAAPGPVVSALGTPSLPAGEMTRMEAWAMRSVDGSRPVRVYADIQDTWQWPLETPVVNGLQCGDLVFVGQQVALDAAGHPTSPGDLMAQTRQVMASTGKVLAAFGLTLDEMVKQNNFYQGEADPATIVSNQRYRSSFYTEPAGASTGVPLPFLPLEALMISVETVAMTRT